MTHTHPPPTHQNRLRGVLLASPATGTHDSPQIPGAPASLSGPVEGPFRSRLFVSAAHVDNREGGSCFADTLQTQSVFALKFKLCLISLVSAEGLEPSTP
jgi:hypothetical protein